MRHHGSILETCYKFLGGQRKERERKRRGIGGEGGLPSPSLRRRAKFPTRCKTKQVHKICPEVGSQALSMHFFLKEGGNGRSSFKSS